MPQYLRTSIITGRISPRRALDMIHENEGYFADKEGFDSILPGAQLQWLQETLFEDTTDVDLDDNGNAIFDGNGFSEEASYGFAEWVFNKFPTYFEPGFVMTDDEPEQGDAGDLTAWDGESVVTHGVVWVHPTYQSAEEILIAAGFTPEVTLTKERTFTTVTEDRA